jgi:DNA polymerase sigma
LIYTVLSREERNTHTEERGKKKQMDIVISAVASELVSRFISFLSKQYSGHACLKQNLEELQRLLLRAFPTQAVNGVSFT